MVRFLDHGKDMTPFDGNAIGETGLDTGNSTLDTKSENRRSWIDCKVRTSYTFLSSNLGETSNYYKNQQLLD